MGKRIVEIDFFKGVLILLMVSFHLIYIGDSYPYLKQVVYTFHMPGFLLLSGYLMKQESAAHKFWRNIGWLFVPYAVMEIGYVVMSSVLPVREAVDQLTAELLLEKLLIHPMGPYWYLHTLMICYFLSRLAHMVLKAFGCSINFALWRFVLAMSLVLLCAQCWGILSGVNVYYFMLGVLLSGSKHSPKSLLWSSPWTAVPLCLCCLVPDWLDRSTPGGMVILYLVFSLLLKLYQIMPLKSRNTIVCIGRNTLPIFLFSPIFTMAMKFCVPWFVFEPTGLVFLAVALGVSTWGSLGIAYLMDITGITPYFCGRKQLINQ